MNTEVGQPSLNLRPPEPSATNTAEKYVPVWQAALDPTIAAGYKQSERNRQIGTYIWYALIASFIVGGMALTLHATYPVNPMAAGFMAVLAGISCHPIIGIMRRRAFAKADCTKIAVKMVDDQKKKLAEIGRHTGREYTMDTPAQEVIDDIRSVAEAYAALHLLFGAMDNRKLTAMYLVSLGNLQRACPAKEWMQEWGILFGRARQILSAATKMNT